MKIKTFVNEDYEKIDELCNDFEASHNVKATQTQMVVKQDGTILHKAVCFYKVD